MKLGQGKNHEKKSGRRSSGGGDDSIEMRDDLFEQCRAGDHQWEEIFALFHHEAFDFLFRMTGQQSRALETLHETAAAIEVDVDRFDNYDAMRVGFFATARSFSADIWGADTSRLQNAFFEQEQARRTGSRRSEREDWQRVDGLVRMLPGPQREALLLLHAYGMKPDEVSAVVGVDGATVVGRAKAALTWMSAGDPSKCAAVAALVGDMPHHPMPVLSGHHTQNLSVLVQDIQEARWHGWARWGVVTGILVAAGVMWLVWSRHLLR